MGTVESVGSALEELAADLTDTFGVPGVAVGIARGDDVAVFGAGVTSIEDPLPVTPATRFQVGSITKTLTSAAIMVLVQQGRVALDDPVSEHLRGQVPGDAERFDAATLADLLAHRLGIDGDHLLTHGSAGGLDSLRDATTLFPPGEGYSYSNAGYSLAGVVIEAASGVSYERFVGTGLLAPVGMDASAFTADEVITHRVAAPHATIGDSTFVLRGFGWQPGWEHTPADRPAAGLISSVEDIVQWGRYHCRRDRRGPLEPASFEVLHDPVITIDAAHRGALDWFVRDINGVRTSSHGGVTVGYVSELLVVPEERVTLAVLTNCANGDGLINEIRREALEGLLGVKDRPPAPDPTARVDERFVGTYLHSFGQLDFAPGPDPATVQLVESPRADGAELWQPPSEGAVIADLLGPADGAEGDALVRDPVGTPRYIRWGTDGDGRPWVQWRGRRAIRME